MQVVHGIEFDPGERQTFAAASTWLTVGKHREEIRRAAAGEMLTAADTDLLRRSLANAVTDREAACVGTVSPCLAERLADYLPALSDALLLADEAGRTLELLW